MKFEFRPCQTCPRPNRCAQAACMHQRRGVPGVANKQQKRGAFWKGHMRMLFRNWRENDGQSE